MRRALLLPLILLVACSRSEPPADPAAFRVALLSPGPVSDAGWNALAYEGLLAIRDQLGAEIAQVEVKNPGQFEDGFRDFAQRGFDLVFGHGFEFQDAATRVAPRFPRTVYVVTSGSIAGPNYAGVGFAFHEPAYIAGIIAASVTRTGVIGCIGGQELPPVKAGFEAFAAGARAVKPSVRVVVSYVGNWDDVSAGREQALAQIAQGVDVIFQNADAAGLGVFQAARETKRALVFGSNADQNSVAPDVILGSVVIDLPHAFLLVAREVKEGRFRGRRIELGADDDVVRLAINPALSSRIPEAVRRLADSVWAEFRAGRPPFRVPSAQPASEASSPNER